MEMKLLIADDNQQITTILKDYAEKEGYVTTVVSDGQTALEKALEEEYDLILLDVMMPKKDGFEVCREIRKTSIVPIIMITARGEDFEKIMGLDIGADDYIVKPFSPLEVMARIRSILRRMELKDKNDKEKIVIKNLEIVIDTFSVYIDRKEVLLTKKELEILWLLGKNPSKIFTRENLMDSIWGYDYYGDARTVDSHIKRLRAKLDQYEHPDWQIKTVWGVGYKLEVNDEI